MDSKARKILKKYKAWKDTLTDEEIRYAIEQGVLYPQTSIPHNDVIAEVKYLSGVIDLDDTIRAFLYSLSTGANEYRTALASLLYAKALPEHKAVIHGQNEKYRRCAICGLKMTSEQSECEIQNSDYNAYRHFPDGYQDICRADFVLFDLQQFQLLPKVDFTDDDLQMLNRIFGLVEELTSSNKIAALQQLITTEKVLPANKNEIYVVLGGLAACGAFDTPEHKGYASEFVLEQNKEFLYEYDLFYPLHFWRGKYGVNYDAVKRVFGGLTGDLLNKEHAIRHEVIRNTKPNENKKSKAEQYFKDGEYSILLVNEKRYYYGLESISPEWDKVVKYSVTYNLHKRSEIYFAGNTIKKMIFEEKYVAEGEKPGGNYYLEFDLNEQTENQTILIPKTNRGKKKPWTPSMLMTPTYMREQLHVKIANDTHCVSSFNSQNDQELPLPKGKVEKAEDFVRYTEEYIKSLPDDYDKVISDFHTKQRVTVKFGAGDVFRVALSPTTYTYGLILGIGRDVLKWDKVPSKHPMQSIMAQPIIFRQYNIVTENKNMTPEDLENISMYPMDMAQDNEILWGTYPIIGRKKLTEKDIDFGFACHKKTGDVFWGFTYFTVNPEIYEDLFEGYYGVSMDLCFATSLAISIYDEMPEHIARQLAMRERVTKELGMPQDCTLDDFAERFGGPTRADYISWIYSSSNGDC
ncbi:immunity 26/phosphotriesterase HocA family protein [Anaerosporobacter sp.]